MSKSDLGEDFKPVGEVGSELFEGEFSMESNLFSECQQDDEKLLDSKNFQLCSQTSATMIQQCSEVKPGEGLCVGADEAIEQSLDKGITTHQMPTFYNAIPGSSSNDPESFLIHKSTENPLQLTNTSDSLYPELVEILPLTIQQTRQATDGSQGKIFSTLSSTFTEFTVNYNTTDQITQDVNTFLNSFFADFDVYTTEHLPQTNSPIMHLVGTSPYLEQFKEYNALKESFENISETTVQSLEKDTFIQQLPRDNETVLEGVQYNPINFDFQEFEDTTESIITAEQFDAIEAHFQQAPDKMSQSAEMSSLIGYSESSREAIEISPEKRSPIHQITPVKKEPTELHLIIINDPAAVKKEPTKFYPILINDPLIRDEKISERRQSSRETPTSALMIESPKRRPISAYSKPGTSEVRHSHKMQKIRQSVESCTITEHVAGTSTTAMHSEGTELYPILINDPLIREKMSERKQPNRETPTNTLMIESLKRRPIRTYSTAETSGIRHSPEHSKMQKIRQSAESCTTTEHIAGTSPTAMHSAGTSVNKRYTVETSSISPDCPTVRNSAVTTQKLLKPTVTSNAIPISTDTINTSSKGYSPTLIYITGTSPTTVHSTGFTGIYYAGILSQLKEIQGVSVSVFNSSGISPLIIKSTRISPTIICTLGTCQTIIYSEGTTIIHCEGTNLTCGHSASTNPYIIHTADTYPTTIHCTGTTIIYCARTSPPTRYIIENRPSTGHFPGKSRNT